VSPIITVVLDAGTVYTVAREVSIPALVFSLNVFAISSFLCYPKAIDIATASPATSKSVESYVVSVGVPQPPLSFKKAPVSVPLGTSPCLEVEKFKSVLSSGVAKSSSL